MIGDNGSVTEEKFVACGRKIPLITIRKKLLEREEQYMGPLYDFSALEEDQIEELYESFVSKTYTSREEAETIMAELSNTRHILMWHDQSVISNYGHILITINTLYDPMIHLTSEEYKVKSGLDLDV